MNLDRASPSVPNTAGDLGGPLSTATSHRPAIDAGEPLESNMSSLFYVPDPDQNEIPDSRQMATAPTYWNWVSQILGASVGNHVEARESVQILRLRANAQFYERQRQPSVISEIVDEAVDRVLDALPRPIVGAVVKTASAMDRAKGWLLEQLASGPKAAVPLAAAAKEAGIAGRTLERARKALGLKPKRMQGRVWWSLPDGESATD
jgi:hypothetical protein